MNQFDAIVVGAGVVGLATAAELSKRGISVLVVDKNNCFGEETSSRNSEVIHAGIYYPTNSLKAKFCVEGKAQLYDYCRSRNINHQQIGKLIVGQTPAEAEQLLKIQQQAKANGVDDLYWLDSKKIQSRCPELKATEALCSPSTGIIDSHQLMQSLVADLENNQGQLVLQTEFISAEQSNYGFNVNFESQGEKVALNCRYLINSAGLYSEQVARTITGLSGENIPKLYWCRGHYFSYQGKSPFKQLIYPVPEKHGLGIHATLDLAGQLKFGPDTQYIDSLTYEINTSLKAKFIKAIKRYWPTIGEQKLQAAYAGIRPKLQPENGGFADFMIQGKGIHGLTGLINLFGIESPGLTASLAIAKNVVGQLEV